MGAHGKVHGPIGKSSSLAKPRTVFVERCLGYTEKPILSGALGQLELLKLIFFAFCQKNASGATPISLCDAELPPAPA